MSQTTGPQARARNRFLKLSVIVPVLMVGLVFAACAAVGVGGYLNAREVTCAPDCYQSDVESGSFMMIG